MARAILASALALALAAGLPAAGARAQDVVRIGTEGAYPPYTFINDQGELDGLEVELGRELCARAGFTCEWVLDEWDHAIIPGLTSGSYDAVMSGTSVTPEREAVIDFTQDYVPPAPSGYVGRSADADVAAGVVAAQAATLQAEHVVASGATLLEFATQEETVAAVRAGEADAVFTHTDFLQPVVEASGGALVFVGEPVALDEGIGMGLREGDGELRAAFDAAIASMKADGSLNALLVKWLGEGTATY